MGDRQRRGMPQLYKIVVQICAIFYVQRNRTLQHYNFFLEEAEKVVPHNREVRRNVIVEANFFTFSFLEVSNFLDYNVIEDLKWSPRPNKVRGQLKGCKWARKERSTA